MRSLAALLIGLLALSILAAPASAMDSGSGGGGGPVGVSSYVNSTIGYASDASGPYSNPGPTYTVMDNDTLTVNLYATDDATHIFYIDMDGNRYLSAGDLASSDYYSRNSSWLITLNMVAGTYTYRDATFRNPGGWIDSGISGTIQVNGAPVPPQPWWHWDPFWIFGLFVEIAMAFWVTYVVFWAVKGHFAKRKLKQTSPEIHKWLKAIMDHEGPTRPTPEYVANIKLGKKKMKAEQEAERKKDGNGSDLFKLPKVPRFRWRRRKP